MRLKAAGAHRHFEYIVSGRVAPHEFAASALLFSVSIFAAADARAGGLFLYEMATPDLGTASAGLAAADNAVTAFGNPAGMTRLDQTQMLVGIQPAYGESHFEVTPKSSRTNVPAVAPLVGQSTVLP